MENLEEQRPLTPEYRESDDKIQNFKSGSNFTSYPDKFIYWPKAAAGYQELAHERLKLDKESVLRSVRNPESESQKMDANRVVLQMMVKEKLQKKELCRKRYGSETGSETETETKSETENDSESERDSDGESESESEIDSDSDSDSDTCSHGDWEWVHYYDIELYPGD